MQIIDIAKPSADHALLVRQESDDERAARLARESEDHQLRLYKDRWTFQVAGGLYVVGLVTAFFYAVSSDNVDVSRWAMSLVTLLAGGLVGYFTGKQTR